MATLATGVATKIEILRYKIILVATVATVATGFSSMRAGKTRSGDVAHIPQVRLYANLVATVATRYERVATQIPNRLPPRLRSRYEAGGNQGSSLCLVRSF